MKANFKDLSDLVVISSLNLLTVFLLSLCLLQAVFKLSSSCIQAVFNLKTSRYIQKPFNNNTISYHRSFEYFVLLNTIIARDLLLGQKNSSVIFLNLVYLVTYCFRE